MAKISEPWKKRWTTLRNLAKGGQGRTELVRRTGDPEDDPAYVLKILTRQDDIERRGRMFREVAALQTLRHDGIPRWVESNTERWGELSEGLYMVLEFIDGPTLEEFVIRNGPMPLDPALACLIRLLEIVAYCHGENTVHRDIKPDNIMFRGSKPLARVRYFRRRYP